MVKIKVPASTSNLGAGFDCFGMALQLYLTVEMEAIRQGLQISVFGEGGSEIAFSEENLVFKAAKKLYESFEKRPPGFRIRINNEIPLSRGLGSSGAATIAGLLCAAKLAGVQLNTPTLLSLAHEIEGHPENASAALLGGLTINCTKNGQVLCKKVLVPDRIRAVLLVPETPVSTEEARKVLPNTVSHEAAVFNLQRSALLTHAFLSEDYLLLQEAMQDRLHQPYRKNLIPHYDDFEQVGYQNGALGVCVSGSGSAILALTTDENSEILRQKWLPNTARFKLNARIYDLGIDNRGAQIVTTP